MSGTVVVLLGDRVICQASVAAGACTFPAPERLTRPYYTPLRARFTGSADYLPSESPAAALQVEQNPIILHDGFEASAP